MSQFAVIENYKLTAQDSGRWIIDGLSEERAYLPLGPYSF
jgi:hypothetical protein